MLHHAAQPVFRSKSGQGAGNQWRGTTVNLTTVSMIQERDYVTKDKSSLAPTQLRIQVSDFLVSKCPNV